MYAEALAGLPAGALTPRASSLREAHRLLLTGRRLLVVLSNDLADEVVETAIRFSRSVGAILARENEESSTLSIGMKHAGLLTGTLGEALSLHQVLLCGVQPGRSHPRLGEVIGKDLARDAIHLEPADPFEAIRWLRLGLAGKGPPIPPRVGELLSRMQADPSGVVFFGPGWLQAGLPLVMELLLWLRDLNTSGRWYAHALLPGSNDAGVTETLLSITGHPSCIRFGGENVEFNFPRWQAERLLLSGYPDLCMLVGRPASFPRRVLKALQKIPSILLDPLPPSWEPCLWLPVAQAGIDAGGSMLRLDGVPVWLEPLAAQRRPRVEALLEELVPEGVRP